MCLITNAPLFTAVVQHSDHITCMLDVWQETEHIGQTASALAATMQPDQRWRNRKNLRIGYCDVCKHT